MTEQSLLGRRCHWKMEKRNFQLENPIHLGLRKACLLSRTCMLDSYYSSGPIQVWKSASTARENEAIQSQGSQQAKQIPAMYGDSWSNELPSTRMQKRLGNLPRFRLCARASQRNGPSYGIGAMVTLANI